MSLIYILNKFSYEAIVIEVFLIGCLLVAMFGYYLFKRRRYGVAKNNISDQAVKAFLVELEALIRGYQGQLFGNQKLEAGNFKIATLGAAVSAAAGATAGVSDAELNALRGQLGALTGKNDELNKLIQQLNADKKALEEKLKAAPANGGAAAPAANSADLDEIKKKLASAEARLAEYEVIEDDLANLKRYQQENKQLKATLEQMKSGGAAVPAATAEPAAAPAPAAAAPAPAPTPEPAAAPAPEPAPIAAAEAAVQAEQAKEAFDSIAPKVEESLAEAAPAPAAASVTDPAAIAAAQTAAPSSDTAAAPAKKEGSDADLLSEFEKMLSN